MKITKDQAWRASIAKWEALVKGVTNYEIREIEIDNFKLKDLKNRCGFCHYYMPEEVSFEAQFPSLNNCGKCPLIIGKKICIDSDHPYDIWSIYEEQEQAQVVLDLILSVKDKHFEDGEVNET